MANSQLKQHIPVFIGSTFEDLKEYRKTVESIIVRLEQVVKGMEYFGSTPKTPLETCLKKLEESKIYIGIIAHRYGSIYNDENKFPNYLGKSFTQIEYERAQELGLPSLIYIMDDLYPIPPTFVDKGEKHDKLCDFKTNLKSKHTYSTFTTPNDLGKKIATDLKELLIEQSKVQNLEVNLSSDTIETDQDILRLFHLRPKSQNGKEILVKIRPLSDNKSLYSTDAEDCNALNLEIGDTIHFSADIMKNESDYYFFDIHITGEDMNMIKLLQDGKPHIIKVQLLFGIKTTVEWGQNNPIDKIETIKGMKLIDIVS